MENDLSYWLAFAHISRVRTKRKNEIIVRFFEQGRTIADFFHSDLNNRGPEFNLSESEANEITLTSKELPNYTFIVEDLLAQGYNILPITSEDYSPALKKNLGELFQGSRNDLNRIHFINGWSSFVY